MLTNKRPLLNYPEILQRRKYYKKYLHASVWGVIIEGCIIALYILNTDAVTLCALIIYTLFLITIVAIAVIGQYFTKIIEKKYIIQNQDGTVTNTLTPLVEESISKFKDINSAREKKYNARREALGKVPKTAREVEREFLFKKIAVVGGAVILASFFFVLAILPRSIFDIGQIEKISVGDEMSYITRILGEPYDKSEIKDNSDKVVSGKYSYCSSSLADEIAKINRKLEKFEDGDNFDFDGLEEMFKLSNQLIELEEQLQKTKCDYIIVNFVNDKVTSVSFLKNCLYGEALQSEVQNATYAVADKDIYYKYSNTINIKKGAEISSLNVRLYFNDGSLLNKQINVDIDTSVIGWQTVTWSDAYGSHEIKVEVK